MVKSFAYEVVVGNIGYVYSGSDSKQANRIFREYRELSKTNYGRAAGESVTLFHKGEIAREYVGTITE